MEIKYHIHNADGSFSPIISDPMGDTDMADQAAEFIRCREKEKQLLIADGKAIFLNNGIRSKQ